jgi:hypothetical protein
MFALNAKLMWGGVLIVRVQYDSSFEPEKAVPWLWNEDIKSPTLNIERYPVSSDIFSPSLFHRIQNVEPSANLSP